MLGLIEDMLLHGRAVEDDVFFLFGQVLEGNVGTYAHGAADVRHQGPHE